MNLELVEKIANAVLYEGYILYPYRPSAVKNRQRFNFGVLAPHSYSLAQGGAEAWSAQTECLVLGDDRATLDVKARFLHLLTREVGEPIADCADNEIQLSDSHFRVVESLEVGGQLYQTWQEAVEREVTATGIKLGELVTQPQQVTFSFPAKQETELLRDAGGDVAGVIIRRQQAIEGGIELQAARCELGSEWPSRNPQLFRVAARILNLTPMENAERKDRDEALMQSLVSAHTILGARDGEFISLLDPPEEFRAAAAACHNSGTWPVLVGEEGERDLLLSSPIILYDYPQIAPESPGDLYDGAEIDEILTLRILTLTEEEKREMRSVDERARRILERTETLSAEHLLKLHGAVRGLRPLGEKQR